MDRSEAFPLDLFIRPLSRQGEIMDTGTYIHGYRKQEACWLGDPFPYPVFSGLALNPACVACGEEP